MGSTQSTTEPLIKLSYESPDVECSKVFSKIFLFIGETGGGKSSIINALVNDSLEPQNLCRPAVTSDKSTGTTDKISYYYSSDGLLIDTPGFFDRNYDMATVMEEFANFILGTDIGINKLFYVMRKGKVKDTDLRNFSILSKLFGSKQRVQYVLVVTHCENPMTLDDFKALNHEDLELMKFIEGFQNVIFGSFLCYSNPEHDEFQKKVRIPFHHALKDEIQRCPKEKFYMSVTDFYSFWKWMCALWKFPSGNNADLLKLRYLLESKRIVIHTDSICLEPVINDIFVTSCGHFFHYDCLRTWQKAAKVYTCPNCRRILGEFDVPKKT